MRIGIDIEKNSRFEHLLEKASFMNRVYTQVEREYIKRKGYRAAAGIFCVKEAFSKALGCGILVLDFQSVCVDREKSGRPYLTLSGKYKGIKAEISISHADEYTTAVCILEENL